MTMRVEKEISLVRDIILTTMPVDEMFLFGSYASGMPNADSDIDIYVVIPDDTQMREIDAMHIIRKAIRERKTMPVDILVAKRNRFLQRRNEPTLERQIFREGIKLYG